MSKILFISDLHGDAVTGGMKRFDDVFGFLADLDVDGIDDIIFCGDLADPDGVDVHACVSAFANRVDEWERTEQRVVWMIPGNHDVVEDGRGTTILDSIEMFKHAVYTEPDVNHIGGINIAFLPYTARAKSYDPGDVVKSWAAQKLKIDLFVGHLDIENYGPGGSETTDMPRGREVFWPLDEIARCYPGVPCVGGHYHKGDLIKFRAVNAAGTAARQELYIVGAPARFTFGEETHTPSYLVLDTDTMSFTRVPIPSRQVVTLCGFDASRIQNGAVVRLKINEPHSRAELEEFAREELTAKRACTVVLGADTVLSAPAAVVRATGELYEDPVAAARRLAEEWPAIDEAAREFRAELVGLVDTIAEEEA